MLITDEKPGTFLLRFSESYVQGDFQGVTGGIVAVIKLSDDGMGFSIFVRLQFSAINWYIVAVSKL